VTPEVIQGFFLLDGVNNYIGGDYLRDGTGAIAPVVMATNGQVLPVLVKMTERNRQV
jgi:hypothetical protein